METIFNEVKSYILKLFKDRDTPLTPPSFTVVENAWEDVLGFDDSVIYSESYKFPTLSDPELSTLYQRLKSDLDMEANEIIFDICLDDKIITASTVFDN